MSLMAVRYRRHYAFWLSVSPCVIKLVSMISWYLTTCLGISLNLQLN